jgi:hypothetical protein
MIIMRVKVWHERMERLRGAPEVGAPIKRLGVSPRKVASASQVICLDLENAFLCVDLRSCEVIEQAGGRFCDLDDGSSIEFLGESYRCYQIDRSMWDNAELLEMICE